MSSPYTFADEVTLEVQAGKGGDGCVAFRREKFVPRGGPSGGDGGDGGDVIVEADPRMRTLLDLRARKQMRAKNGEPGRGKEQNGAAGDDAVIRVPAGTLVYDLDEGELLGDLTAPGERFVVAHGGRGGRGNLRFASSTNRAPRKAEAGLPGDERRLRLELKLMADVGLLGYPNVGKSTFLSHVSSARPRVADYPFTTLKPTLGVCRLSDLRSFVVADIPGLVEGASEGVGLGHRFLKHLERTKVLLHLLDPLPTAVGAAGAGGDGTPDLLAHHDALNRELANFSEHLAELPQVVCVNKLDTPEAREALAALGEAFAGRGIELLGISAATGEGVPALLEILWRLAGAEEAE